MLLNGKYLSFRTLRIMVLCKTINLWSSSLQPTCLLPLSTRCNQLPPLSWGFYTHLSPDIRQHCHILSRALLWSSKRRPLAMEISQEKGIQKSSVIFTAPPVALLAPSRKKHHVLCVSTRLRLPRPPQDSTSSIWKLFSAPRSLPSTLPRAGLHQTPLAVTIHYQSRAYGTAL